MPTIEQAMNGEAAAATTSTATATEQTAQQVQAAGIDLPKWVTSKTGPGDIEDYVQHPFNPVKSKGMAQSLRGLTGILGDLDKALVDICMGFMRLFYEGFEFISKGKTPGDSGDGDDGSTDNVKADRIKKNRDKPEDPVDHIVNMESVQ